MKGKQNIVESQQITAAHIINLIEKRAKESKSILDENNLYDNWLEETSEKYEIK